MSDQEKQALITALRMLTATPKSRMGLQQKLVQKGYSPAVLKTTLDQLERQGILNDRTLAQSFFHSFLNYRPSGRRRIAFELQKKGIGQELIQEVLEGYSSLEEREKALELARQCRNRCLKLEPQKRRKKIYNFLLRRGFDFSISREAIEAIEREK